MLRRALLTGLAAALLFEPGAARADAAHDYLERHPDVDAADLLGVEVGDDLARVLAVVHHPPVGVRPARVTVLEGSGDALRPVTPTLDAAEGSATDYVVVVQSRCPGVADGTDLVVDSWFHLPGNRLVAFGLQPFTADCRPEPALVEASDHETMRAVGEALFRRAGRGRFHYGPLSYDSWDEAFAARTRTNLISQLRARATSHPREAGAANRLGVALYAAGDREGAIEALRRASQLDPAWDLPHRNLAVVHVQRGEIEAAERETALAERLAARPDAMPPEAGGARP